MGNTRHVPEMSDIVCTAYSRLRLIRGLVSISEEYMFTTYRLCRLSLKCGARLVSWHPTGQLGVSPHIGHTACHPVEDKGSAEEKVPETGALSSARTFSSTSSNATAVHTTVISQQTRRPFAARRILICFEMLA